MVSDFDLKRLYQREAVKKGDVGNMSNSDRKIFESKQGMSANLGSNPFNRGQSRPVNNTFSQGVGLRKIFGGSTPQTPKVPSSFSNLNHMFKTSVRSPNIFSSNSSRGASVSMQRQWKNKSFARKISARTILPDSDGDRVPDKYDCQPRNRYRQDTGVDEDTTQDTSTIEPVVTTQYEVAAGPEKPSAIHRTVAGVKQKYQDYKEEKEMTREADKKTKEIGRLAGENYRREQLQKRAEENAKYSLVDRGANALFGTRSDQPQQPRRQGGLVQEASQGISQAQASLGYGTSQMSGAAKVQQLFGHQQYMGSGGFFGQPTYDQRGKKLKGPEGADKIAMLTGVGSSSGVASGGGFYNALGMKNPYSSTYAGRDPNSRREYMRNYMRNRRSGKKGKN